VPFDFRGTKHAVLSVGYQIMSKFSYIDSLRSSHDGIFCPAGWAWPSVICCTKVKTCMHKTFGFHSLICVLVF